MTEESRFPKTFLDQQPRAAGNVPKSSSKISAPRIWKFFCSSCKDTILTFLLTRKSCSSCGSTTLQNMGFIRGDKQSLEQIALANEGDKNVG